MKERLDKEIFKRGLAKSRTASQALIEKGKVLVNQKITLDFDLMVEAEDQIDIIENLPFASRAGEKLENALKHWPIEIAGKVVVDIGASTGGFTSCLLQKEAKRIYAIDVGTDQLALEIRNDPRVVSMEKTDIRKVESLPELADLAVVDVSFISLSKILPAIKKFLKTEALVLALIKPQFEQENDSKKRIRKGVVRNEIFVKEAVHKVIECAKENNFEAETPIPASIRGEKGNQEYFVLLKFSPPPLNQTRQ